MSNIYGQQAGLETDIATAGADESIAKGNVVAGAAGSISDTIGSIFAQRAGSARTSSYGGGAPIPQVPLSKRGTIGTLMSMRPAVEPYRNQPISV